MTMYIKPANDSFFLNALSFAADLSDRLLCDVSTVFLSWHSKKLIISVGN